MKTRIELTSKEDKPKEEKWYRTFWDFIIPNEPENDLEYSGKRKKV